MTYRVAIVGSRKFPHEKMVRHYVQRLPTDTVVISGGARGPDRWAVDEALKRGLKTVVLQPDWETHGKAAGPIRNAAIVENCDWLVAFWDGHSRGTLNTLRRASSGEVPHAVFKVVGGGVSLLCSESDPKKMCLFSPEES